jgi:hypothetical protein
MVAVLPRHHARREPSGLNVRPRKESRSFPPKVSSSWPLEMSQIFAVPSWLPETRRRLSGLQATLNTASECPRKKVGQARPLPAHPRIPDLNFLLLGKGDPAFIGARIRLPASRSADHPQLAAERIPSLPVVKRVKPQFPAASAPAGESDSVFLVVAVVEHLVPRVGLPEGCSD